jgi:hypothetical protein
VFGATDLGKLVFAEVIRMIRMAGVLAAVIGAGILVAPAAAASEDEYLDKLQPKYEFLSAQQLLTEGNRVCTAEGAGALAPDRTTMVINDLQVSVNVALEIVSAAEWNLC